MPTYLLNFKPEFAIRVESGEKVQTIRRNRADGKKMQPGDTVKLYTGLRTRNARCLRVATVVAVNRVRMNALENVIVVDGDMLDTARAAAFARADGFSCVSEMLAWFKNQYMSNEFDGFCVQWHAGANASAKGQAGSLPGPAR